MADPSLSPDDSELNSAPPAPNGDTSSPRTVRRLRKESRRTLERQLLQDMIQRKLEASEQNAQAIASPMQRERADSFAHAMDENPELAQAETNKWTWWSAARGVAAGVIPYVYSTAQTPVRASSADLQNQIEECRGRLKSLEHQMQQAEVS